MQITDEMQKNSSNVIINHFPQANEDIVTIVTRSKQAQACNTAPCLRISDIFT